MDLEEAKGHGEMLLVGGTFLNGDLEEGYDWLGKYFFPGPQRVFLSYYLQLRWKFGDKALVGRKTHVFLHESFEDHAGIRCSSRWVYKMLYRINHLEERMRAAVAAANMDEVAALKSGRVGLFNR